MEECDLAQAVVVLVRSVCRCPPQSAAAPLASALDARNNRSGVLGDGALAELEECVQQPPQSDEAAAADAAEFSSELFDPVGYLYDQLVQPRLALKKMKPPKSKDNNKERARKKNCTIC